MCFLETGRGRATTIRFDYAHPPASPPPARIWHWCKALFNKTYWHTVPQGRRTGWSRRLPLYQALRSSLSSAAGWRRFVRLAREARLAPLERWIGEVEGVVAPQLARRDHPRSTGALETALREVKTALTLQRSSNDSIERLNLILGLMTLRANHLDREHDYAELARRHRVRRNTCGLRISIPG